MGLGIEDSITLQENMWDATDFVVSLREPDKTHVGHLTLPGDNAIRHVTRSV